jgi:hypothetical protein
MMIATCQRLEVHAWLIVVERLSKYDLSKYAVPYQNLIEDIFFLNNPSTFHDYIFHMIKNRLILFNKHGIGRKISTCPRLEGNAWLIVVEVLSKYVVLKT